MVFEYQLVQTSMAQIDIDDIGNCCLLSRNTLGEEWYLYVRTEIGVTQIIYYGPIVPDFDELPANVSYTYQRFDFNERKIISILQKFISISEYVEQTNIESIKQFIKPMLENLNDYGTQAEDTDESEDD